MSGLLSSISRTSLSGFANMLLMGVALGVSTCGIGLTALYLMDNIEETPALTKIQCFVGFERPDCPDHLEKVAQMQQDLEDLLTRTQIAESQLEGLRAIESVDEVTLFNMHDDPASGYGVHIGTVYDRLTGNPVPDHYFCYISLPNGPAGEGRNLHFHGSLGPIDFSSADLKAAGVTPATLSFARSVCQPFLVR